MATILYVDDEPAVGPLLERTLERAGHRPIGARGVPEALAALATGGVDLIICAFRMTSTTGLQFLAMLRRDGIDVPLIMLTASASSDQAIAAMRAGAIGHVTKPVRAEHLELAVTQALEIARLRRENESLNRQVTALRSERPASHGASPDSATLAPGHAIHLATLNVAEAERVLIQRALAASKQNRTRAAELLGISVRTLRNKLNVRGESTAEMAIDGSDVS